MNAERKWTPGPWLLCAHLADRDQCPCGYRGGIWGGDGEVMVCEMGGPIGSEGDDMIPRSPREVQFADAHLIAAAPDMYEALKAAGNSAGFQYMPAETREKIDAALSKAEGR